MLPCLSLHYTKLHCSTLHPLKCIALHCTTPHYTMLNWTRLNCIALHYTPFNCTALHRTTLNCSALHCTILNCNTLSCAALHYTKIICTALHYTKLGCTALCCTTLNCTALHCTTLGCTLLHWLHQHISIWCISLLQDIGWASEKELLIDCIHLQARKVQKQKKKKFQYFIVPSHKVTNEHWNWPKINKNSLKIPASITGLCWRLKPSAGARRSPGRIAGCTF